MSEKNEKEKKKKKKKEEKRRKKRRKKLTEDPNRLYKAGYIRVIRSRKLDQRGCRFPDEMKIELRHETFKLPLHDISDVMCLEK